VGKKLWRRIKRWSVVDTYLGFGVTTRVIFAVMFVAGAVLCVSLWLTDLGIGFTRPRWMAQHGAEWLHNHAYIPNILAGFTGFLVGVPVALVALETVIAKREDNVEIVKAKRVSAAAWHDFRSAVGEFVNADRRSALLNDAPTIVYPIYEEIFGRLNTYRGEEPFATPTQGQYDALMDYLKAREVRFKAEIDAVTAKVGNIDALQKSWSRVLSTWSVLNTYVRSRRIELDLPWFNDDSNSTLVSALATTDNPLSDFSNVHSGFGSLEPPGSMEMARNWVRSYIMWGNKDKFDRTLQSHRKVFGVDGVDSYRDRATQAGLFLTALDATIKQIDEEGWPDPPEAR
jgi:hypothetical protein